MSEGVAPCTAAIATPLFVNAFAIVYYHPSANAMEAALSTTS